jgi:ubiquinone/menaquinone biosynthesis C-methylase UbiE
MVSMNFFEKFWVNRLNKMYVPRGVLSLIQRANLQVTGSSLEIGAGIGYTSLAILEKYHPDKVVITDFDISQVEKGQKLAAKKFGTIPSMVEYRQEDALQLSFEDRSFDFVIGTLCFHHIEGNRGQTFVKTPKAFQEVNRVLKPAGIFLYWDLLNRTLVDDFFKQLRYATLFTQKEKAIYQKPN